MIKKTLLAGLGWILSQTVLADVSPQLIVMNCQSCHAGPIEGVAVLNTLSAENIKQALLGFKNDQRQSTVMGRIAKGFSDAELTKVAQLIGQAE